MVQLTCTVVSIVSMMFSQKTTVAMELCKSWTLDWTMDWTMDWTTDWTDQNSCTHTANVTQAMKGCNKLLPSLLRHRSSISERSKVMCIFNELQQWAQTTAMDNIGIFLLVLHFTKGWSLIITALQAGRAS